RTRYRSRERRARGLESGEGCRARRHLLEGKRQRQMGEAGLIEYLLPIAIMLAAVVHIIKTGRNFIWVYVVIFIPLFGALAYAAVEIVPEMFKSRTAQKLGANAKAMADPNKSFREARRAAEMTGSVDSKRTLAEEYARRGDHAAAIEIYRDALVGHFAD